MLTYISAEGYPVPVDIHSGLAAGLIHRVVVDCLFMRLALKQLLPVASNVMHAELKRERSTCA